MRPRYPEKPYTITKSKWDSYFRDQQRGHMNMYAHYLIGYFCQDDAYDQAYEHFKEQGKTEDLVIE